VYARGGVGRPRLARHARKAGVSLYTCLLPHATNASSITRYFHYLARTVSRAALSVRPTTCALPCQMAVAFAQALANGGQVERASEAEHV
jgi:hypothetical protein